MIIYFEREEGEPEECNKEWEVEMIKLCCMHL